MQSIPVVKFGLDFRADFIDSGVCFLLRLETDCLEVFLQVVYSFGQERLERLQYKQTLHCYWESWIVSEFILSDFDEKDDKSSRR